MPLQSAGAVHTIHIPLSGIRVERVSFCMKYRMKGERSGFAK